MALNDLIFVYMSFCFLKLLIFLWEKSNYQFLNLKFECKEDRCYIDCNVIESVKCMFINTSCALTPCDVIKSNNYTWTLHFYGTWWGIRERRTLKGPQWALSSVTGVCGAHHYICPQETFASLPWRPGQGCPKPSARNLFSNGFSSNAPHFNKIINAI